MANRAIEPVLLPWKRPKKGVSVAVLGARFRVEQLEDGWHCTVKVGRQVEVLATGLPRLRDAQFRAEAHAATLPAVMAALNRQDTEDRRAEQKPPKTPATPTATAARARIGTYSRCPPLVPPRPPGCCTEWVASNTTGQPVAASCGRARMSETSVL